MDAVIDSNRVGVSPSTAESETGFVQDSPIKERSINNSDPHSSDYSCFDIADYPWVASYDIMGDGRFGRDDIAGALYPSPRYLGLSSSSLLAWLGRHMPGAAQQVQEDCLTLQFGFLREEVKWTLQDILADQYEYSEVDALIEQIDSLEASVLADLDALSQKIKRPNAYTEARAGVVEMCFRARQLVNGVLEEPFGLGLNLVAVEQGANDWEIQVLGIHPKSQAAQNGLMVGDRITHVDGVPVALLSVDGTAEGFVDPESTAIYGFAGSRKSQIELTVNRDGDFYTVTTERNIWSARVLTVKNSTPAWTGDEAEFQRPL